MKRNIICLFISVSISLPVMASPYFFVDSAQEWQELLSPIGSEFNRIEAGNSSDWEHYMMHWQMYGQGEPVKFGAPLPPDLYVCDGVPTDPQHPDEPGLVMAWGNQNLPPDQDYSAAWKFMYGLDPDLSNCTISLKVHPPSFITNVSFGLTDINGKQCSWSWNVPGNIPVTPPPTTITINTNNIATLGINAPAPAAASFAITPGFDITQIVSFFINETFHTTPGVFPAPVPGPGSTQKLYWNAWDEFQVLPNVGGSTPVVNTKWWLKWSQPPVEQQEKIFGWDDRSTIAFPPLLADDWECSDYRPVTDVHWWGSFIGWTQPYPPTGQLPQGFHIGIWTDVPVSPTNPFSHPGNLVWENKCESFVWNFAGYDLDPRDPTQGGIENEACFQFAQFLSQDQWFHQKPNPETGNKTIYWISIGAYYSPNQTIQYPWGWKTRPKFFNDDAVRSYVIQNPDGSTWPNAAGNLQLGATWQQGQPIEYPAGKSWDLSFELTTNEKEPGKCYDNPGDIDHDCKVDLTDFTLLAQDWLKVSIP